ncbi:MAG: dNTP triphosphohydrolase [Marinibacterium sp.]|nr:dNTP triphosphohydrolase [Marinibacterium sp.]
MDWGRLLNSQRYGDKGRLEDPARPNYAQDADRLIFSAPFRRLANKTQVHPLYDNDHLRHRLIHSVEVASVGRSLGMQIGQALRDGGYDVDPHRVAGVVHAACLAHDIGNPPFGHSGEASIGAWCAETLENPSPGFENIAPERHAEFTAFEGNAQGFRILTRLEMRRNDGGMRLSNAVLGAFMKYPMGAATSDAIRAQDDPVYVGAKKHGFFESERALFAQVADAVGLVPETGPDGLGWWRRHPLVFAVEAADDICYNIVDLEDGFTAGDLSFDKVRDHLAPLDPYDTPGSGDQTEFEQISHLRARAIGGGIVACADAFAKHHDDILAGRYSGSLIESSDKAGVFADIKTLARGQLFVAPRKTMLEVKGRNVLRQVLDGLAPVYDALAQNGWQEERLPDYEKQVAHAVQLDLRDVKDGYSALQSLTDFVSGMTDRYAVRVAGLLTGAS